MSLDANAIFWPSTSTTTIDLLDAQAAARTMPHDYRAEELLYEPGGRRMPCRQLRLTPTHCQIAPSFYIERGPLGLDVLAIHPDGDTLEELADDLGGTFATLAEALGEIALSLSDPLTEWSERAAKPDDELGPYLLQ